MVIMNGRRTFFLLLDGEIPADFVGVLGGFLSLQRTGQNDTRQWSVVYRTFALASGIEV